MWLNSPVWLMNEFKNHCKLEVNLPNELSPEIREVKANTFHSVVDSSLLTRFSSYTKLVNVTDCMFRFHPKCKKANSKYLSGLL